MHHILSFSWNSAHILFGAIKSAIKQNIKSIFLFAPSCFSPPFEWNSYLMPVDREI